MYYQGGKPNSQEDWWQPSTKQGNQNEEQTTSTHLILQVFSSFEVSYVQNCTMHVPYITALTIVPTSSGGPKTLLMSGVESMLDRRCLTDMQSLSVQAGLKNVHQPLHGVGVLRVLGKACCISDRPNTWFPVFFSQKTNLRWKEWNTLRVELTMSAVNEYPAISPWQWWCKSICEPERKAFWAPSKHSSPGRR